MSSRCFKLDTFPLDIAQSFRAHTIDSTINSFVFEVTGNSSKLAAFINLMKDLGWEPKVSIEERINEVVQWTLNNDRWLKV